MWNELLAEALAVIRKTNPTRNVVIGPAFWNNISLAAEARTARGRPAHHRDRALLRAAPLHAPGRELGDRSTRNCRASAGARPRISRRSTKDFDVAQAWAKKNDRPILLGEFGAYDKAPQEDRIKYTAAVARAAEKRGWAWTYWQFDSNFIVYDIDKDAWNEPIYRALVPSARVRRITISCPTGDRSARRTSSPSCRS